MTGGNNRSGNSEIHKEGKLKENTRLNNTYTLKERIGQGGGGIVYKAYHENLQIDVVVKMVRERVKGKLDDRGEADILKRMKHTYLPRVYDFLEIDGEIYTVIDFIPGRSLDKVLEEKGSFPQSQVLKWTIQLAEALAYLHEQKPPIIHSDIKPANIMLTPEGNICLIDFNISLAFDRDMVNSVGISGGYSPPEQYPDVRVYKKIVVAEKTSTAGRTGNAPENASSVRHTDGGLRSSDKTEVSCHREIETASTQETEAANAGETEAAFTDLDQAVDRNIEAAYEEGDKTEIADQAEEEPASDDLTEVAAGDDTNDRGGTVRSSTETERLYTATEKVIESMVGHGVDERSDIYSLGATIYHLLTGVKPSNDFENIPPITSYQNVQIGEAFALILTKMMALNPDDRYQNGGELLDALRNIYELDSEYKAFKRKRKLQKMLIGAAFLAGGALIGYGLFAMRQENTASYNRGVEAAGELITAGEYDQAQDELDLAVFRAPKRISAYEKQTLRLYSMGSYEDAISYGKDVINNVAYVLEDTADESSLANIFYLMGNSYMELEDYVNAAECLKLAIIYDSNNGAYYRDYAVTLARTGNSDDAETALSQAIALGLGQDTIYMTRGEIAYAGGDYEAAVDYLTDAMRATQDNDLMSRAVVLCAKAYQALGNDYLDEEISLLESAESSTGTQSDLQTSEMLADAYTRKAQLGEEDSEAYYEKALAKFQDLYDKGYSTRQMMENIAILYQEMGSYAEAMDMLLQMEEKYPDDYRTYKRLAYLEADYQQSLENSYRDYSGFYEYYHKAAELYASSNTSSDSEMQMLEVMLQDLKDGGWLN